MSLNVLQGIRVVSFTQFLLGPAGVQHLADLGADVIKVEPPQGAWERHWTGGDHYLHGESVFFLLANRNCRSIAINLKHPAGRELAQRLCRTADIVVQNYRPGVAERLGVGYETLRQANPGVIYISASGYGGDGPYRDLPGQDLQIQALTGLAAITGHNPGPPTAAASPVVDHHGAALLALGALAALRHRERTGEGQHVELNMVQAGLDLQRETVAYHLNGFPIERSRTGLATNYHPAPYGIYKTTDGYLALSASPLKDLYAATGDERLAPYVAGNGAWTGREEICRIVTELFATGTTASWLERLRRHGVWAQPVNGYDETFADPGVRHLDPVMTVETAGAGSAGPVEVKLLKFPIRFGAGECELRHPPPAVGEHTLEVLRQAGYTESEILRLRTEKAVAAIGDADAGPNS